MRSYTVALDTAGECLDKLEGDQLLAMEPDLRCCLEKHEGNFPSLILEPCVNDCVEFAYNQNIANALRVGISKIGYIAPVDTDSRVTPGNRTTAVAVKNAHFVPRNVHFTLTTLLGKIPNHVAFETPLDTVVVEVRNGSEQEFLRTGIEGPVVGRVVLHTKFKGAKYLRYESEHFFESLSQRTVTIPRVPPGDSGVPTVRFTKTLRVTSRRGERFLSRRSQSMSRIGRSREVGKHSYY